MTWEAEDKVKDPAEGKESPPETLSLRSRHRGRVCDRLSAVMKITSSTNTLDHR